MARIGTGSAGSGNFPPDGRCYTVALTEWNKSGTLHPPFESEEMAVDEDKRSAWLKQLDEECPYQVVLPRHPFEDDKIMQFLSNYVEKFDMYVEDEYARFVRYCFADPLDAAVFRSRFERKEDRLRLAS